MKRYEVLLTAGAEHDLEAIYDYLAEFVSVARAEYVLTRIMRVAASLESFPQRGTYPPELLELGIRDFRQTWFKPYRLIYRIVDRRVLVHLIADGRRNMQTLLAQRLLAR